MVVSKLPRAGLGNKLFVWAHGVVFSNNNKLKHVTVGWVQLMIGPFLRGEKSKRLYNNYFKSNMSELLLSKLNIRKKEFLHYNQIDKILNKKEKSKIFYFTEIPHWSDYFLGLREYRTLVVKTFFESLNNKYKIKYEKLSNTEIGIHIRMGDFKVLNEKDDFSKIGQARTPLDYFELMINNIRKFNHKSSIVTIFSDGNEEELMQILKMPNVSLSKNNNDLLDMLHLSKSKVIILSSGSTFGQWSAYLSNAIIIHHPSHYHSNIRNFLQNNKYYEGIWDENNSDLIKQITSI